jgi:hypothetical protein
LLELTELAAIRSLANELTWVTSHKFRKTTAAVSSRSSGSTRCVHSGPNPSGLAKAQTLALAGRRAEAQAALHEVRGIYDSLPPDNRDSIYGWPEDRLRFTESYVFTYLGDAVEATAAQDRAINAYPSKCRRGPAQIELQRALWMVNTGDVSTGVERAAAAIQSLPSKDQIRPIVALAKEVLGAVPAPQISKPAVVEFRECLEPQQRWLIRHRERQSQQHERPRPLGHRAARQHLHRGTT